MLRARSAALAPLLLLILVACTTPSEKSESAIAPKPAFRLVEVATSDRQWTGMAVGAGGRIFVSFPRWSDDVPVSVGEIVDGRIVPYPDVDLNSWSPKGDAGKQFVCAQSLVADAKGALWILDPANPRFEGIVDGGPKLVRYNLTLNRHVGSYRYQFEDSEQILVTPESYLNDVRIDLDAGYAYITDSGDGAIIVTELRKGMSRRLLDDHPSTRAEEMTVNIGGKEWLGLDGAPPRVHADGIALSPDREWLYYHALTGRTLYRVPTAALRDEALPAEDLEGKVEKVAETGPVDGMIFGADGWLYISAIEENAVKRVDTHTGRVEMVVQDPRIQWPDSFALDDKGRIWFTTSRIHLGADPAEPCRIFRIDEVEAGAD